MANIVWNIQREGRAWRANEAQSRWELTPPKFEMIEGMLLWSDEDRLNLLGLLLENVGIDQAIRLGDPRIWREAIDRLEATS